MVSISGDMETILRKKNKKSRVENSLTVCMHISHHYSTCVYRMDTVCIANLP